MLNILKSEWIKLRTTRSFWWTTALFLLFSWGWAGVSAAFMEPLEPEAIDMGFQLIGPEFTVVFLVTLGLPVLMIQAIMLVTTEYRFGTQAITFMASPRRWSVAVAKLVLYAVIAAVLTFIGVVGAYLLTDLLADSSISATFDPWNDEVGREQLWKYPLAAALVVAFAQGVGMLIRQTAGSVALCLILYLGVDQMVSMIPVVGDKIGSYMPFTAFQNWLSNTPVDNALWTEAAGSGVVFFIWAVVLWALGVLVLHKRDA